MLPPIEVLGHSIEDRRESQPELVNPDSPTLKISGTQPDVTGHHVHATEWPSWGSTPPADEKTPLPAPSEIHPKSEHTSNGSPTPPLLSHPNNQSTPSKQQLLTGLEEDISEEPGAVSSKGKERMVSQSLSEDSTSGTPTKRKSPCRVKGNRGRIAKQTTDAHNRAQRIEADAILRPWGPCKKCRASKYKQMCRVPSAASEGLHVTGKKVACSRCVRNKEKCED
jgi:hypothetical protein